MKTEQDGPTKSPERKAGAGPHPLATVLEAAARGTFPPADGAVEVVGPPPGPCDAVVAFSSHNVIAAGVDTAAVEARLFAGDPGAPMHPDFLLWLGERLGSTPGMLDLVMVAFGRPGGPGAMALTPRADMTPHPRVRRSLRYRTDVAVYSDPDRRGVAVLGRGLAGRAEVSIEVDPAHRGGGLGRALAEAATTLIPHDQLLFAQVSPGNVASVRAFLAAGFRPICSEVLFLRPV